MNIDHQPKFTIVIREAQGIGRDAAETFYRSVGYTVPINPADRIVVAIRETEVVGVVRICEEHDHLVLRGMQVAETVQRQGIGSRMLHELSNLIGSRECWCLPYPHLEAFYQQIGFEAVRSIDAPQFLQQRLSDYLAHGASNIVMKREAAYNNPL